MKKKSLLFINAEGLPFGYSASANKIRLMGEILSHSDIDVYTLNKRRGGNNRKYGFYKGIKFAFFNTKSDSTSFFNLLIYTFKAHIKEFSFVKRRAKKYESKYILIHYDWFPIFLYYWLFSKLFNIKIVINIMEWHIAVPSNSFLAKINAYLFDKLSFRMASGAIPISKFIENKVYGINKNLPTFVLPAITDFNEIENIRTDGFSSEEYLLYCGNLGYLNVIKFVLESYSNIQNRNVKLMLVVNGKKDEFEELNKLIDKFKIQANVNIKTNLTFQTLISSYKNALALLIPLRNTEQDLARFPHKISEYTATKRPIITTGFGVINDFFDKENAFICCKYSAIEYSKVMDEAINNPLKSNMIGINGNKVGLKFLDTKSYYQSLPDFIKQLK